MQFLYRGVSESHFNKTQGMLIPKILSHFIHEFYCGEGIWCGCRATCGPSTTNAVIRHQLDPEEGFPTSGISTTPILDRAWHYATAGGKETVGYIYKIDRSLFKIYGVTEYIVKESATIPSIPIDEEAILVASDFGILPLMIVAEILSSRQWSHEAKIF